MLAPHKSLDTREKADRHGRPECSRQNGGEGLRLQTVGGAGLQRRDAGLERQELQLVRLCPGVRTL
jgi:hypothetical protein